MCLLVENEPRKCENIMVLFFPETSVFAHLYLIHREPMNIVKWKNYCFPMINDER
jgi:hypothetical protein